MKAKLHLNAILTIVVLSAYTALGQTKQYATSSTASHNVSLTASQNTAKAYDGDLSTFAYLTTTSVVTGVSDDGYIELKYPAAVNANTASYIKVNMQDNQLAALLGGSIGNLLNSVLGIVFGQQYLEVQVKNGASTTVMTSSDFTQPILRVVQGANGDFYIMVTPNAQYDRIRITNKLSGLLATRWLNVYDAFYVTGSSTCAIGNYTSFDGGGILTIGTANVYDGNYAIDAIATNYSRLNLGTLGVGQYLQQTVHFEGTPSASDTYNIKFQIDNGLVNLGVLGNIKIIGYSGATEVYNKPLTDNAFLAVGIANTLAQSKPVTLSIQPGVVDRITVRYEGLANVGALSQELQLYGIVKGNFGASITGGGSCQVGASMPLSAVVTGCTSPYTYTWTGVTSTTSGATPSTATPGTYNYTVTVTDVYGIQKTATTAITVVAPPVAGTVSSAQVVCSETLPANLTLAGYTGNIIKWQKSADAAFTAPVDIANTTATLTGSGLGTLSATTYVRAVVGFYTYANVTTPGVQLKVQTTTWNGTAWSSGVPDISTKAIFTGNYSADANISACRIEVSNNAVVTIPAENVITVDHNIKVISGNFTLQNNAHLLQLSDDANVGNVTVKRNGSALYRLDYTMWSSPVDGQQLQAFSPLTGPTRFYHYGRFDPDGTYYEEYESESDITTNFITAKSYLIRMPNTITGGPTGPYYAGTQTLVFEGNFTGVPHNGPITFVLSQNGDRYTAVGNPYPSPINVHAFFDANAGSLMPGSALYFWRKKSNSNATTYCSLTRDAYVYNHADGGNPGEGQYGGMQWDNFFNNDVASNQWVLNPGQGFIVKAANTASPVLTFNNAMRRGPVYNNQFFKSGLTDDDQISRFWLNLTGTADAFAQTAIVYSATATLDVDYGRDGLMMQGGGTLSLYSVEAQNSFSIQARPKFDTDDVVAMGYRADNAGMYTITLNRKDGVFNSQPIYLKDNLLGQTVSLTDAGHTFTTDAGTFDKRFEVLYNQPLGTTDTQFTANNVIVYKQDNTVMITMGNVEMTGINVYDIRGRLLYNKTGINAANASVSNLGIQHEVIIVEVTTIKGKVSKKIVY